MEFQVLNVTSLSQSMSQGSGLITEESREKRIRTRGCGLLQGNSVFWTQQGSCTNEATANGTVHIRKTCTTSSPTKS